MKLQTPDYYKSYPFEPYIKRFILNGLISHAQFAHRMSVSSKLFVEDLKVVQTTLANLLWAVKLWYSEVVTFIKSTKASLDRIYISAKNLYDILNGFIKICILLRDLCVKLRDLCVQSENVNPELFNNVLSTLDLSIHEITLRINLEQTSHLTSSMQYKDSVKALELGVAEVYRVLEPTIDTEAPELYDPVPAETFMNTTYSKYLDMSIEEIIEQLHRPI